MADSKQAETLPGEQTGPPPYSAQPDQPGYPPAGGPPGYPPAGGQPGYPPAGGPPGYPPQPGYQTGQTVVVTQPVYGVSGPLPGSSCRYQQYPMLIVCQHCGATVTTTTTYEVGLLTYAAAGIICLFGCWLGCCLIPFCIDASKDVTHTCPNCNKLNGKFRHLS